MSEFSRIGLVGRLGSEAAYYSLQRLISFLKGRGVETFLDTETAAGIPDCDVAKQDSANFAQTCDLVIVVGGDGSLLSTARQLAGTDIPILGINRGRLGFLTDISPEEIERKVGAVIAGRYSDEYRSLLESEVVRNGEAVGDGIALNDVVLHPGRFIRMIDFELFVDEEFVYRQRSDGLIISTPTGSTAYALSCGGPIMHPSLDAIVLVPMNTHTLNSRPIVVNGQAAIRIVVGDQRDVEPNVTCDGQTHVVTHVGDEIWVKKSPKKLRLIHPKGYDFYKTCRSKLGWEEDRRGFSS